MKAPMSFLDMNIFLVFGKTNEWFNGALTYQRNKQYAVNQHRNQKRKKQQIK